MTDRTTDRTTHRTTDRPTRHIVATSSGGFLPDERYGMRPGPLLELCRTLSGADEPRVCGVFTATGDDAARRAAWYAAMADAGWRPSHLALFPMPNVDDVRAHLVTDVVDLEEAAALMTAVAARERHVLTAVFTLAP